MCVDPCPRTRSKACSRTQTSRGTFVSLLKPCFVWLRSVRPAKVSSQARIPLKDSLSGCLLAPRFGRLLTSSENVKSCQILGACFVVAQAAVVRDISGSHRALLRFGLCYCREILSLRSIHGSKTRDSFVVDSGALAQTMRPGTDCPLFSSSRVWRNRLNEPPLVHAVPFTQLRRHDFSLGISPRPRWP